MGASRTFTDDILVASSNTVFDFNNFQSFFVAIWAKTSGHTVRQTAFDKRGSSGATAGYALWVETTGTVQFFISDGTTSVAANYGGDVRGSWVHFTTVVDRSAGEIRLYINGALVATTSIGTHGNTSNTGLFYLGDGDRNIPSSSLKDWNGQLAQLHIAQRVPTVSEIQEIMRKPASIINAMGYVPIYGVNSPEPDLSGSGKNLTVTGAVESSDGPPIFIPSSPRISWLYDSVPPSGFKPAWATGINKIIGSGVAA